VRAANTRANNKKVKGEAAIDAGAARVPDKSPATAPST